jgi:transcriptional regulator with XRE-family HTH domain
MGRYTIDLMSKKKRRSPKQGFMRTHLKAWRKHRGLTLEQLAARVDTTAASISRIENGKQPYTQALLEALALALSCAPADIIMRDPAAHGSLWSIWDQIQAPEREQALRVLETFTKKTGTAG